MYKRYVKRIMDFVFSFAALIVFLPLMVLLTIIGVFAMKGNPFFVQIRPGKDEKLFKMIKFRSMTSETDEKGKPLADEIRLNRYGRFIRSTSLDELPELLNIIKGEMSIVGPRPLLIEYLPLYSEKQRRRHDVRPGMTGLAQINGRNATTWAERFRFDISYVETLSPWLDVKIIWATIIKVIKREGAAVDDGISLGLFRGNG
ncbi:MAG: sugar transferase [Lachnospiraceae bacterium]|nr:sugar transferase [Lachnospiraceae bacterium]